MHALPRQYYGMPRTRPIHRWELMLFLRYGALSWKGIRAMYLRGGARTTREDKIGDAAVQSSHAGPLRPRDISDAQEAADNVSERVRETRPHAGQGQGQRVAGHDLPELCTRHVGHDRRCCHAQNRRNNAGVDHSVEDVHEHVGPGHAAYLVVHTDGREGTMSDV